MNSYMLIWLFPIVFMIHEFEEIIFIRGWISRNKRSICEKYPRFGKRILTQCKDISTEVFSLIVAEEFIIVAIIVIIAGIKNNYNLFLGLVIAYCMHLLMHIIQTIIIKKYIPAIATTILTGFYCLYVMHYFINNNLLNLNKVIIYGIIMTVIAALNLLVMHKLAKRIEILN
ncbi:HXXEE domain-containing protein [Clostridium sp. DL1XJH146]